MPPHRRLPFNLSPQRAKDITWQGAMGAAGETEVFVRGQTSATLGGSATVGLGRRPEDAAAQADLALTNLATLLREAGSTSTCCASKVHRTCGCVPITPPRCVMVSASRRSTAASAWRCAPVIR